MMLLLLLLACTLGSLTTDIEVQGHVEALLLQLTGGPIKVVAELTELKPALQRDKLPKRIGVPAAVVSLRAAS